MSFRKPGEVILKTASRKLIQENSICVEELRWYYQIFIFWFIWIVDAVFLPYILCFHVCLYMFLITSCFSFSKQNMKWWVAPHFCTALFVFSFSLVSLPLDIPSYRLIMQACLDLSPPPDQCLTLPLVILLHLIQNTKVLYIEGHKDWESINTSWDVI